MYAVVSSGGKQYRVEPGSMLTVERLTVDAGASVTFDRVLLVGDGETILVGTPIVDGAAVSGTVIGAERGPKIIVFKFKQKVKYRRRTGHRQHLTRVRIDSITANGRTASAPEPAAKPAAEAKPKRARRASASARKAAGSKAAAAEEAPPEAKPKRARKSGGGGATSSRARAKASPKADTDATTEASKPAPRRKSAEPRKRPAKE